MVAVMCDKEKGWPECERLKSRGRVCEVEVERTRVRGGKES